MSPSRITSARLARLAALLTFAVAVQGHAQHDHAGPKAAAAAADARKAVAFPAALRAHTLANMRDHLAALAEVQQALAAGEYETAAQTAERRLGMSSLPAHGSHEVARYMPQGMQDIGTSMHRGASRFAVEVQNSAASGDLKPALAALAATTQACVACHAAYRLR